MSKDLYIEHFEMNFQHFWLFISGSKTSQFEVLQSCEPELNFTGRTPEHKKPAHQPSASVLFFFSFLSNR
jgi:hypothetical protein